MATDKPRFTITLSDELFGRVERYQKENNISTRSKAVARLVAKGLQKEQASPSQHQSSKKMDELMEYFGTLNQKGQEKVISYAADLYENEKYSKNSEDQLA